MTRHHLPSKFASWNPVRLDPILGPSFFRSTRGPPTSRPDCLSLAANATPRYLPKMFLFRYSLRNLPCGSYFLLSSINSGIFL
jgi:hypothetical protein